MGGVQGGEGEEHVKSVGEAGEEERVKEQVDEREERVDEREEEREEENEKGVEEREKGGGE